MFRRILDERDYSGADLIWLLEINWGGALYRFSNKPIMVPYDGGELPFEGQLENLDYTESSDLFDLSVEANSISVSVVFPVDMIQEFRAGRILDGSRGELSYIMSRGGSPLQTWEERILLFEGEISQPIIGDPEEPSGFAAFSIEQQPYDMSGYLIDQDNLINKAKFPSLPDDIGPERRILSFLVAPRILSERMDKISLISIRLRPILSIRLMEAERVLIMTI